MRRYFVEFFLRGESATPGDVAGASVSIVAADEEEERGIVCVKLSRPKQGAVADTMRVRPAIDPMPDGTLRIALSGPRGVSFVPLRASRDVLQLRFVIYLVSGDTVVVRTEPFYILRNIPQPRRREGRMRAPRPPPSIAVSRSRDAATQYEEKSGLPAIGVYTAKY